MADGDPSVQVTGQPSLLDQMAANPVGGIMSLLSPIVTGGGMAPSQGQVFDPSQQASAVPAFLAFAERMAQAGAPTLGPPTPLPVALTEAMGSGYGAALQSRMLPVLSAAAGREAQAQDLALQQQQFNLNREQALWNLQLPTVQRVYAGASALAGAPGTPAIVPGGAPGSPGTTPGTPVTGTSGQPSPTPGPPATVAQVSALPDVQKLPPDIQTALTMAITNAGMSLDTAAQYARMIQVESGGQMRDQNGNIITSPKGAVGVAQVMPGTFADMAKKYNIQGSVNDLVPNLTAGAHYFQDGVAAHGLRNGVIYYNAGPQGLTGYLQTGQLPDETTAYLAKTGAPGAPGAGNATVPSAPGMVVEPSTGALVPGYVLQNARMQLANINPNDPTAGLRGYQQVISTYLANQRTQIGSGQQVVSGTGQVESAPTPTPRTRMMTDAEIAAHPQLDPRAAYQITEVPGVPGGKIDQIGMRGAYAQLDQENKLRQEYQSDPTVNTFRSALPYLDRMNNVIQAGGSRALTGVDDYALLKNYAHLNDPNAVVKSGDEESLLDTAGLPGDLKIQMHKILGSGGVSGVLTDAQRQWLLQSATTEMQGQQQRALQVLAQKQRIAGGEGIRPNQIGVPEDLSLDPKVRFSAPTTTQPAIPRPGVVVPAQSGAPGAPGTTLPVPPVPPAGGAPQPTTAATGATGGTEAPTPRAPTAAETAVPPPGKVTPAALAAMSPDALIALGRSIARGGGYSSQEAGMIAAAISARLKGG